MIGYVTLGTNDREKSSKFYDALCGELGVGRMMENDEFIAWGKPGGGAQLARRTSRFGTVAPALSHSRG